MNIKAMLLDIIKEFINTRTKLHIKNDKELNKVANLLYNQYFIN